MKWKQSTEDYLKTIYAMSRKGEVRCCRLAESLSLSRATVSVSVKALVEEGLIDLDEKKTVSLTPKGLALAKAVTEKHAVLSSLLISLGVAPEIAQQDACRMEHAIGEESFQALKSLIPCP